MSAVALESDKQTFHNSPNLDLSSINRLRQQAIHYIEDGGTGENYGEEEGREGGQ